MRFEFVPYERVNDMYFGDEREKVKSKCGVCTYSGRTGYPEDKGYEDSFEIFALYCDEDEKLEGVNLFPDISDEDMFLSIGGKEIKLNDEPEELYKALNNLTDDLTDDGEDSGWFSEKLGVMVYCPDETVESVLLHKKGYES